LSLRGRIAKIHEMKRFGLLALSIALLMQPACFWRLWTKETPIEERTFDVYGEVKSITQEQLVIQTKRGEETFILTTSSIKGSDFGPGATVHVYYRKRGDVNEITMVVEKVG
jgi:hypothetical protein